MQKIKRDHQLSFLTACTIVLFFSCGCGTTKQVPKYQLSNGLYKSRIFSGEKMLVYIDNSEDTVTVYQVNPLTHMVDALHPYRATLAQVASGTFIQSNTFKRASFDVDFLTIPFKFRTRQKGVPQQFNTNLNGAVYLGYRSDIYQLQYQQTPLTNYQRHTQHYGFSAGFFTGLGGTTMNPSVTSNLINYEYDGAVWSKGLAGIIGINNFTIGLAFGYDHLLDNNKRQWVYQGKPWVGFAFGLNLN